MSNTEVSVAIDDDQHAEQPEQGPEWILLMQHRLKETALSRVRGGGDLTELTSIFRFTSNLTGVMNDTAHLPQLVSIGPYHRGEDHLREFEKYKWYYLKRHLSSSGRSISTYLNNDFETYEKNARAYYLDMPPMSSEDFMEMMTLDSCFVIQFLIGLASSGDERPEIFIQNGPIFATPWLIPILLTDLLKLENQIPFSFLERFWPPQQRGTVQSVVLKVFNMLFQMPWDSDFKLRTYHPEHLLDLFHLCFRPSNQSTERSSKPHVPSVQSIQSASRLSVSGMKFSSKKANSFLDIEYRGRSLKIPSVIINDWTGVLILNCVALEQRRNQFTYFSSYVVFMKSLLSEPKDVALLCSNKIISSSSKNDQFVVNFFNKLGEKIDFNIRDCYLSKEFSQLEAFYSSFFPTITRQYFSTRLTSIATIFAPTLVILALLQFIFQYLQYRQPLKR